MEYTCQNCTNAIELNFCSNCGQKKFKRIDKKYILDEVQYSLIHTNKGFLYSAKKILRNPGKTAHEFISGNRVNHYKPILLVFLLSGISAFISFKIIHLDQVITQFYTSQHMNSKLMNDMLSFMASYNSFLMLLLVPIFALFTKIALRKWGQNYYEHIIMNAYVLSFYTMISIIIFSPIIYLVRGNPNTVMLISNVLLFATPAILIWFYKGFYPEKSIKSIIIKVLIIMGLMILAYFILIFVAVILGIIIALVKGVDILQYVKPNP